MNALNLIEAIKTGNFDLSEPPLHLYCDLEQADEHGWTALNWAAGRGLADTLQKLMAAGADINHAGRDKRTAYEIALAAAHPDAALILQSSSSKSGTGPYCKAYLLGMMQQFPGWPVPAHNENPGVIVYLHEDLRVTRSLQPGVSVIYDRASAEWESFCKDALHFSVPSDLALATHFAACRSTGAAL